MPDIATALKSALNQWENQIEEQAMQTEKPNLFSVTNNVSRETFNYIKQNPGITTRKLREALAARGFNDNSVGSLATQMVRAKIVLRQEDGALRVLVPEYKPLKDYRSIKNQARKASQLKAKLREINKAVREAKVAAAPSVPSIPPAPVAPVKQEPKRRLVEMTSDMSEEEFVDAILKHVSIFGARVLYDKLCVVFKA